MIGTCWENIALIYSNGIDGIDNGITIVSDHFEPLGKSIQSTNIMMDYDSGNNGIVFARLVIFMDFIISNMQVVPATRRGGSFEHRKWL